MSADSQFDRGDAVKVEEENSLSLHELAAENDVQQLIRKLQSSISGLGVVAVVNQKNDEGRTPLHVAAINNEDQSHFEVTEILLKNGADPNAEDQGDRTPLFYLVENHCSRDILKLFLKFKADFNCLNNLGASLLKWATKNSDNLEVIKFLVEDIGLDVNHRDDDGLTPLHDAASNNKSESHYDILEYLLKNGADVNAREIYGCTPLYRLVEFSGNWKVFELFLKHNSDIHAVTDEGESIIFAFDSGDCDLQLLERLINDFGLDVNRTNNDEFTPLHHHILNHPGSKGMNIKVVKCFLKNGASINAPDKYGVTPFIGIMRQIKQDMKEWFLEKLYFLQLVINQVDFSKVHNNVHILDTYKKYGRDLHNPEFVWKWILEHLAKLKFINISVHPVIIEFIERHADHKDYFNKCIEELQVMKNTKPQNSWINFFNLLVDSRRKLNNYAGSEDLIQDYEYNDWLKIFPIYGALLKKNVEKGLRRRKLFDESSILLSDCLPIFDSTHLIVKDILDCILSKKDLSKFCNNFVPLDSETLLKRKTLKNL